MTTLFGALGLIGVGIYIARLLYCNALPDDEE